MSTPAIDVSTSATGETITGREIGELPVNGRNYLDLLQLVPGVAINRQVDPNTDRSNPVLGERSGNNNFLIDGQSNKDTVNGGPGAAVHPGNHRRVPGADERLQGGVRAGVRRDRQRHYQERQQPASAASARFSSGTMRSMRRTRWTRRGPSRWR